MLNLKSVEAADFRSLDLGHKSLDQVLVHDSIRSGEEGENMLDEILLALLQLLPIVHIARKVDLFSRPERGDCLFVESPDV